MCMCERETGLICSIVVGKKCLQYYCLFRVFYVSRITTSAQDKNFLKRVLSEGKSEICKYSIV